MSAATARSSLPPRRVWIDLAVIALLCVLGIAGLETSFGSYNFLVASLAGLVVGFGVAILASVLRWNVLLSVSAGIVAYFLVGTPVVLPGKSSFLVLPTLDSLSGLAFGAVYGWADILTLNTPVQAPYYIAVLPYFAAWLVALIEGLLVLRWFARRPATWRSSLLLLGPALLFLIGILLGTDEAYLAAVRGVTFAVVALIWSSWRRGGQERIEIEGGTSGRARRVGGIAVLLVGAVVIGGAGGWLLQPERDERFVLRETVVPPFDPTRFPSPLASFRSYTKLLGETEIFTVDGLETGDLVRLAAMDAYDGILWTVSGSVADEEGSGSFRLVGEELPESTAMIEGESSTVTVTIGEYADVWLPTAGYATHLEFLDDASRSRSDDFRYNEVTGTAVLPPAVQTGYQYRLETVMPGSVDDSVLAEADVAAVVLPPADNVPDILSAKALEYAGSEESPIAQLRALEVQLKTAGFLSHGLASDSVPSRSGHGADRMSELFERPQMVGDEEQYASAFALMARSLGFPARVVMGFAPETIDGPTVVLGENVTAWVEVPFDGHGWIPFFPTPDETDVPQDQVPKPQNEPQPQVRQPPRMENEEEDLLTPVQIDDSEEDSEDGFSLPGWVVTLALSILIPVALAVLPMLAIGLLKARRASRRRRGRGDDSVAGAWDEFIDRSRELGYVVPPSLTRPRIASRLAEQGVAVDSAVALAERADTAVFSGAEVDAAEVDAYWREIDAATESSARALGPGQRLLARYRIRSLGRRSHRPRKD